MLSIQPFFNGIYLLFITAASEFQQDRPVSRMIVGHFAGTVENNTWAWQRIICVVSVKKKRNQRVPFMPLQRASAVQSSAGQRSKNSCLHTCPGAEESNVSLIRQEWKSSPITGCHNRPFEMCQPSLTGCNPLRTNSVLSSKSALN